MTQYWNHVTIDTESGLHDLYMTMILQHLSFFYYS